MSFNPRTAPDYQVTAFTFSPQHSPFAGDSKNRLTCPEMKTKAPLARTGVQGGAPQLEAEVATEWDSVKALWDPTMGKPQGWEAGAPG